MSAGAYVLTAVMGIAIIVLVVALLLMRQHFTSREETKDNWQKALLDTVGELHQILARLRSKPDWAKSFCELVVREFRADGAALYLRQADSDEQKSMRIQSAAGDCEDWLEGLQSVDAGSQIASRPLPYDPGVPEDFFWSRRPLVYHGDDLQSWLPPDERTAFGFGLVAPVNTEQGEAYLLILRRDGRPAFENDDQIRLSHCITVADAGFRALEAENNRHAMEQELNYAHEEGMLQISTGIIHNIGNGITVIQIALERLASGDFKAINQLTQFIDREIMPELQTHLKAGDLQEFLTRDKHGKEYLQSLQTLIEEIPKILDEHRRELDFVVEKFRSVTEIITLQQQFIGELGTENVVQVNSLMRDVVKMCQDPMQQRNIELKESYNAEGRILVDPAMLRHILLLIIKYAIDSASSTRRARSVIKLKTAEGPITDDEGNEGEETWVRMSVADNGAGSDIEFNEEDLIADRQNVDEKTRDLFFCKRRVEKYGGRFDIHTDFGHGTRVTILLPAFDEDESRLPPKAAADEGGNGRKDTVVVKRDDSDDAADTDADESDD